MKRTLLLLACLFFIVSSAVSANQYEMYFKVTYNGDPVVKLVTLYRVSGDQLVSVASGYTKDFFVTNQFNGGCDIEDNNASTTPPESTIKIWDPLYNFEAGDYVIVIDSYYIRLYIGLTDDIIIFYQSGSFSISGSRDYTIKHQGSFSQSYNLSFNNNFEDGLSGGQLYFDGGSAKTAPYNTTLAQWTWGHTAGTKTPQTVGGFTRKHNNWVSNQGFSSASQTIDVEMKSANYTNNFNKYYDVVIQNQLPGYSNQGQITVQGSSRNSPYSHQLKRELTFTAAGILQYIENIKFTFSHWLKNGQTTGETSPFTPTANNTYSAVYTAKPVSWGRNISCTSPVGQPIVITWTDHPSTGVTSYQVYRKINGGSTSYLGSVNRGVNSYTDPLYVRSNSTADDLLLYDVRPYYSPSSTYADAEFSTVTYGFSYAKTNEEQNEETELSFGINNYPNPFNPETRINYQLPEKDFVNLRVYNSIGEFVVELINETKEKGAYYKDFDGSKLPSGVYYAVLKTNKDVKVSKMLLTK